MKLSQRSSGLIVPVSPPEPEPEPEKEPRYPLELDDAEEREIVANAFRTIISCVEPYGMLVKDKRKAQAREELVYAVAKQLLGLDWDFERLC